MRNNIEIYDVLRKLIALQYFIGDMLAENPQHFASELCDVLTRVQTEKMEQNSTATELYWMVVAYSLANIGPYLGEILEQERGNEIVSSSVSLCWSMSVSSGVVEWICMFLVDVFYSFRFDGPVDGEIEEVFDRAMKFLTALVLAAGGVNAPWANVDMGQRILEMLRSDNVSLTVRQTLVSLLNRLAQDEKIGFLIIDASNIPMIVKFIGDYLRSIPFSCQLDSAKEENLDQFKFSVSQENTGEMCEVNRESGTGTDQRQQRETLCVTDFIDATFPEEITILSPGDRPIKSITLMIPEDPPLIAPVHSLNVLVTIISNLCHAATFQPIVITNSNLMKEVIAEPSIRELEITPFFVASWLRHFVSDYSEVVVDSLHNIGFYQYMLESAFLKLQNKELMSFCTGLLIAFAGKYDDRVFYMEDLLRFLLHAVDCLHVENELIECTRSCICIAEKAFKIAANVADLMFIPKLSRQMMILQHASMENKDPRIAETRARILKFVDFISAELGIFEYCLGYVDFQQFIMALLYDPSTVNYACYQVERILTMRISKTMACVQSLVKFLITRLFCSRKMPMSTLARLIALLRSVLKQNGRAVWKLFKETRLLLAVVDFSVEMNAKDVVPGVIDMLSQYMVHSDDFALDGGVFMKLEPLLSGSVQDYLLNMAFNDDLGMTVPRRIVSAAPVSLLFSIFSQKSDAEFSSFISFVEACFAIEKKSASYELQAVNFPGQLIRYLTTYRSAKEIPKVFDQVLLFFCDLSSFSLTAEDLVSFFRMFTTCPGNYRPAFTCKLLKGLLQIMSISQADSPSQFINMDGNGSQLSIQKRIKHNFGGSGFCFVFQIELLNGEYNGSSIFSFVRGNDRISLTFADGCLSFGKESIQCQALPRDTWFELGISYQKNILDIYVDGKLTASSACSVDLGSELSQLILLENVPCNLGAAVLCHKPFPHKSKECVLLAFSAMHAYGNLIVSGTDIAQFNGKICQIIPVPKDILREIGGVFVLLPLFAQLEQPTIQGTRDEESDQILLRLLQLLKCMLDNDPKAQDDFLKRKGFAMISVLLSLSSEAVFRKNTMAFFGELFLSLERHLAIQMIEHLFFNVRLWLALTDEREEYVFPVLFKYILDFKSANPNDKDLSKCVNITNILYLMRHHLYDSNKGVADLLDGKPGALEIVRLEFWEFIEEFARRSLTDVDVQTLISFCQTSSDLRLARDSLKCFLHFLESKLNNFVHRFENYDFSKFVALAKIADPEIFRYVIDIFVCMSNMNILSEKHKVGDWVLTFVQYIDATNATLDNVTHFIEKLPEAPFLSGLVVYMMIYLDGSVKLQQFRCFSREFAKLRVSLTTYMPYFILFMFHLYMECSTKDLLELVVEEISQLIIQDQDIACLSTFHDYVIALSAQAQCDLSGFLRMFFMTVLGVLERNRDVRNEKRNHVYYVISNFIFSIPAYDKFYFPPFAEQPEQKAVAFKDLVKVFARMSPEAVPCCYATRTSAEGDWVDADLAALLLSTIINNQIKPVADLNPIDFLALIAANGIMHRKHYDKFLVPSAEFVLKFAFKHRKVNGFYRNVFFMVTGAIVKAILAENRDLKLVEFVSDLWKRNEALASIKVKMPEKQPNFDDIEQFKMLDFVRVIVEEMSKIEEGLRKCVFSHRDRGIRSNHAVSWLHVKTSNIEDREIAFEQFSTRRREAILQAKKQYRKLFQSFSLEGGPWSTPEISDQIHWQLDNAIFSNFVRNRMKINRKYTDHKEASLARDLGSYEDAKALFQAELSKLKLEEFKGDFALMNFGEEEKSALSENETISQDNVKLKCDVKLNTPKKLYSGTLLLTDRAIFINTTQDVVRIPLSKMTYLFLRRYLLIDTAIEIYTSTMRSFFINFATTGERQDFLVKLAEMKPKSLKFFQRKQEDVKRLAKKLLEKWQKGSISNFDFLMKLNIYAGRSYNDLGQYPVMPWIIADYESEKLDLTNPKSFRDLSVPLGAMDKSRLEIMQERMNDTFADEPRYLYGALYSSAAVVVGYLIRMEPFTTLHLNLQSGRFDLPDRLFTGLASAWESVTTCQMDFRELIPEFFIMPQFLTNHNRLDLGKLAKTGETVDDVVLPVWASSPQQFIDIHRQALECKYVTANLHHWVDLIFGSNSRLPEAEHCNNTYHPYFYETALDGNVAPDMIKMIKEYAACFGSVPAKLFDKPISQRMPFIRATLRNELPLEMQVSEDRILCVRMRKGVLMAMDDNLNIIDLSKGKEVRKQIPKRLPDMSRFAGKILCDTSTRYVAIRLPWINQVDIFNKTHGAVFHDKHTRPVTCLEMSENFCVSGSMDGRVHVVHLRAAGPVYVPTFVKHNQPLSFVRINESIGACASISKDGLIRLISLVDCQCIHTHASSISDPVGFCVARSGIIVAVFNSVDSFIVKVLDSNLNPTYQIENDGLVESAHSMSISGLDYLILLLRDCSLRVYSLPTLEHRQIHPGLARMPVCTSCSGPSVLMGFADGTITRISFTNL